ncbi:hypothetical protein EV361DRAFT_871472 [Lentinula raphanica]|nr:hypothetical protein EV361DRAFT_871472 [Lentinula raphanica]
MTRFVLRAFLILGAISSSGVLTAPTLTPHSTVDSEGQALQSFNPPIGDSPPIVNALETRAFTDGLPDWRASVKTIVDHISKVMSDLKLSLSVNGKPFVNPVSRQFVDNAWRTHSAALVALYLWQEKNDANCLTPVEYERFKAFETSLDEHAKELERLGGKGGSYTTENADNYDLHCNALTQDVISIVTLLAEKPGYKSIEVRPEDRRRIESVTIRVCPEK